MVITKFADSSRFPLIRDLFTTRLVPSSLIGLDQNLATTSNTTNFFLQCQNRERKQRRAQYSLPPWRICTCTNAAPLFFRAKRGVTIFFLIVAPISANRRG